MSRPKFLEELVRAGTFRRDRHLPLFEHDCSIFDLLEKVDRGRVTVAPDEQLRLEHAWYWQASYREGSAALEIALTYFVAAMRGDHPPGLPPGMEDDA